MKEWQKFAIVFFSFFIVGIYLIGYSSFPNVRPMDRSIILLFGIFVLSLGALFTILGIRKVELGY